MKKVNIFDFDGTIYDGDSTIDFYKFCVKKNKKIIKYLPFQMWCLLLYKIRIISKKSFKEKFFVFLKSIDNLNVLINDFWNINEYKIKKFYSNFDHSNDVIISASPAFLINVIGIRLKVFGIIATTMSSNGNIIGENCYGYQKVIRFKEQYPDYCVMKVYTDSLSDLPIMKLGKEAYIVKGNNIVQYNFQEDNYDK